MPQYFDHFYDLAFKNIFRNSASNYKIIILKLITSQFKFSILKTE